VWFSAEAIEGWRAAPRPTRGGQPWDSPLAIRTALPWRAVVRLARRQTEGLIGAILRRLGLDLPVPDPSPLSRRAETLEGPRPWSRAEPVPLLGDSTGLQLCGAGEWWAETHGTRKRRAWKTRHLGLEAGTGRMVAAVLTDKEADDGAQGDPLLEQVDGPIASLTGDGASDQEGGCRDGAARHPAAAVIGPPRSRAVPSQTAETAPTQRDRPLPSIAEHGRLGWPKASGDTLRAWAAAAISRDKRGIGDTLRSQTDGRPATEVAIAVGVLNRMLELGRPESVRLA
jgi:Transposase DDE domain